MPLWYVVWMCKTYLLTKGHAGSRGGGGHTPKLTTRHYWNIWCNKPTFLSKINSACAVTLHPFVGIVKCLCGQQTCTSILEKRCRLTIGHRLKVCMVRKGWRWGGWLRNRFSPFWMHYFRPKYILIVSQFISNFNTLRIIWKFYLHSGEF